MDCLKSLHEVEAPVFKDRLEGDLLFARVRSMDLECPRCGDVWHCSGKAGPYNRRTGRFCCPSCGLTLAVGVIVYPVTSAPGPQGAPPDWTPTYRQALALRAQLPSALQAATPKGWTDPHNVVLREGCKCEQRGRGLVIHPGCPVHGSERSK